MSGKEITGRQVFFVTAAAFSVIIGVNLVLAVSAVRTFPGLEVKNSYVASQTFDRDRAAQEALGWKTQIESDGTFVRLSIRDRLGNPVVPASLDATLGRATHVASDQSLAFSFDGRDHLAEVDLANGYWNLRFEAVAEDGTRFRQRLEFRVRSGG